MVLFLRADELKWWNCSDWAHKSDRDAHSMLASPSVPLLATELRKQKLAEYLKAKGRFKEPDAK